MKIVITYVLAVFIVVLCTVQVRAENVAVVLSSDVALYQEVLEGFREVVRHTIGGVQILQKNNPTTWQQLKTLRSEIEPDLVFVIGTSAFQRVSGDVKNIPVVHALAFDSVSSSNVGSKHVYGISMVPSADQAISLLKELNPKLHRVGTMYDPSRNGSLFSQTRVAFQNSGLQFVGKAVRSVSDIGAALKSLESNVDILWLWPDDRFLAEDVLQRIFLFSFERKIPVLGLSERHTEMGALVSLSYGSAKDMGRQAGELVNGILSKSRSAPLALVAPRQLKFTLSLKTAHKLGIEVPESVIRRADNAVKAPVYKDGDWWVFRIKMIDSYGVTKTEIHRVIFKQDKFASDDPNFLSGGDVTGTPYFLPFASVYLSDPARRWLDFPLLVGKKWSFRYRVRGGGFAGGPRFSFKFVDADAEVIGKTLHPIETPAGRFAAVEIGRTDNDWGALVYQYSPQSQSVVKLRAQSTGYQTGRYELELIDYGTGGNMGKNLR